MTNPLSKDVKTFLKNYMTKYRFDAQKYAAVFHLLAFCYGEHGTSIHPA